MGYPNAVRPGRTGAVAWGRPGVLHDAAAAAIHSIGTRVLHRATVCALLLRAIALTWLPLLAGAASSCCSMGSSTGKVVATTGSMGARSSCSRIPTQPPHMHGSAGMPQPMVPSNQQESVTRQRRCVVTRQRRCVVAAKCCSCSSLIAHNLLLSGLSRWLTATEAVDASHLQWWLRSG